MADKTRALKANIPGRFFVDSTCINCDNCRDVAPSLFGEDNYQAFVKQQPESLEETDLAELALLQCPRGSIGSFESAHIDSARLHKRYPQLIEDDVFLLGYNSPKAYGGKSYLVKHEDGNWMIDGPKFHPDLVAALERMGGLRYIFLTHRDDVGDAEKFASHFGAERIIHENDLCTQPGAELVLKSFEPTGEFGRDFLIIGTPGHTEGHCMLLYKNKFLFSGDTLTSRVRFDDLIEAWDPMYCWFDWDTLTESLRKLSKYSFQWLLPGHGRRTKLVEESCTKAMLQAVQRCEEETNKEPISYARLEVFEAVTRFATDPLQKSFYREKSEDMRRRLTAENKKSLDA